MTGLHLIADLWGCPPEQPCMSDGEALAATCLQLVAEHGLSTVGQAFHRFTPRDGHQQAGVTGVVLLAESHLAVHTWPELGRVTLDVFVCNQSVDHSEAAKALLTRLEAAFEPAQVKRQVVRRGGL